MAATTDPAWNEWRRQIFGDPYMVWHDGPSFGGLESAYHADSELTDRMLVQGVVARDSLAAQSIGRLEPALSVPRALSELLGAEDAPGEFSLRRAQTLFGLTGDPTYRRMMLAVLAGSDHWGTRIEAAIAVGLIDPTGEAIAVLEKTVTDDEYLVRYHSANALLQYAGEDPQIAMHPLFDSLASPHRDEAITDEHRTAWRDAARQLATAARAVLGQQHTRKEPRAD